MSRSFLLIILALTLNFLSAGLSIPETFVHAQTAAFDYSLSNTGGVTLLPGGSGSNNITATLIAGIPTNVTLSCMFPSALPPGTSCSFKPTSVTPAFAGNSSILTITTPASTPYGNYNVSVTGGPDQKPISPTSFTLTVGAKVAINPTSYSLPNYHGRVSFQVNLTGSLPFSAFDLAVNYNPIILQNPSIEFSNNVFGTTDVLVSIDCVNGIPVPPGVCSNYGVEAPGVAHLNLLTVNGENSTGNPTSGKLFNVTFDAAGTGFSSIHILFQQIIAVSNVTGAFLVSTVPIDGYFANIQCGGNPCQPPMASFRTLTRPVAGRDLTFNATAISLNCCPKGNITFYTWSFGTLANLGFVKSPNPNATILFSQAAVDWPVTLLVNDTYGATVYVTRLITVIRIWVDLGVLPLTIGQVRGVLPGTVDPVKVTVVNYGVDPANSSVRLFLNDKLLMKNQVENIAPNAAERAEFNYTWDTTGLSPRVYRIQAILDPVRDPTTSRIIENDTDPTTLKDLNGISTSYVQLIQPIPSGFGVFLGLGLPQTIGLGIIVLAAIGFTITFARRAAARGRQPLS